MWIGDLFFCSCRRDEGRGALGLLVLVNMEEGRPASTVSTNMMSSVDEVLRLLLPGLRVGLV